MVTVHLPHERQHPITGQAFVYMTEYVYCNVACTITALMIAAGTAGVDAE